MREAVVLLGTGVKMCGLPMKQGVGYGVFLCVCGSGVWRGGRVAEQEAGESLGWNETGRRGEPRRPLVQRLRGARLSRARRASPDHDLLVVAANHRVAG